jgi:hypothetical protein
VLAELKNCPLQCCGVKKDSLLSCVDCLGYTA